jgi:tetratricopeptide (TPR) repeat protein
MARKNRKHAKRSASTAVTPPQSEGRRILPVHVLLAVVIVAAGVWAFAPSFRGVFIWDDRSGIVDNPNLRTLWPITSAMGAPRDTTLAGRPVASLTFALNYALAPLDVRDVMKSEDASGPPDVAERFYRNVWGYHAVNLVVHLMAALALFGIARRTFLSAAFPDRNRVMATWLAFVTALLWVVHPLNTQAVTYLVQRVECMMGLFYLLTLYSAIRALDDPKGGRRRWWTAAAIVACALGMGTKESMVTAPLLVGLWDWLFAPRDMRRGRWPLYVGLASTWLLLAYLVSSDNRPHSVGVGLGGWTSWLYLQTQLAVLVHYLRLAVVPTPLVLDYRWAAVRSFADVLPHALVLAALVGLTGIGLYRRRPAAFAGAWFFLILAPTSSVLPIATEAAAEQRMYLPLAAAIALLVVGGYALARRVVSTFEPPPRSGVLRTGSLLVLGIAVVTLALLTRARNEQYASDEILLADTVQKRPDNAPARVVYGSVLLTRQRFADAEAQMKVALTLQAEPEIKAHANMYLGSALCAQGRFADGVRHLTDALKLDPTLTDAHALLAEAYDNQGQSRRAAEHFHLAVMASPDNPALLRRVSWFLATSPEDDVRDGAKATELAERARALTGGRDPMSLEALGAAYAEQDRFREAVGVLSEALAVAQAQGNLAYAEALRQEVAVTQGGRKLRLPVKQRTDGR